ncbi:MAG TPA: response regulator [Casimicrobiaceae bacterium]|jgi:DNA-binding NtrC family response regulator
MARIIVVERDQLMRALLVEWLGGAGYTVAAYSRIDAMPDAEAELVIVDVRMPRDGGCAGLRDMQASRPRTPLIAISGQFTAGSTGVSACALGVRRVIGKPFTRERLLRAVGEVLTAVSLG